MENVKRVATVSAPPYHNVGDQQETVAWSSLATDLTHKSALVLVPINVTEGSEEYEEFSHLIGAANILATSPPPVRPTRLRKCILQRTCTHSCSPIQMQHNHPTVNSLTRQPSNGSTLSHRLTCTVGVSTLEYSWDEFCLTVTVVSETDRANGPLGGR